MHKTEEQVETTRTRKGKIINLYVSLLKHKEENFHQPLTNPDQ
jgi:hypothetical protein